MFHNVISVKNGLSSLEKIKLIVGIIFAADLCIKRGFETGEPCDMIIAIVNPKYLNKLE